MSWMLITAAVAAGPENGDFEAGLAPWTDESTQPVASAFVADEGDDFGDYSNTSTINFPSGTRALVLKSGSGGVLTPAGAGSAPFVVTSGTLQFRHRSEDAQVVNEVRLRSGGQILLTESYPPDTSGALDTFAIDVVSQCGSQVDVQFLQYGSITGFTWYTAIDSVELLGTACPDYVDDDGDGFCVHGTDEDADGLCDGPTEAERSSLPVRDCDDGNADRFPGNPEIEGDGVDQDCDGFDPTGLCYADVDGDGFGGLEVPGSPLCDQVGETPIGGDCDDNDDTIAPNAMETAADGIDSDCDGVELCYVDGDGDGFGGGTGPGSLTCDAAGEADNGDDCDDSRAEAFPGAPELCNGSDDDCDGTIDPDPPSSAWPDLDADGFGDSSASPVQVCDAVSGVSVNDGDCNDSDAAINPDAIEVPDDGVNQDCSGAELCFEDLDGDGYAGDVVAPGPLDCAGFPADGGDCDDTTGTINPGRPETCDGIDNDCDLEVDEGTNTQSWYVDLDDDGFGDDASVVSACVPPTADHIAVPGDCDDADAAINPAAAEVVADEIDQNCDGAEQCYGDSDGDGYGGMGEVSSPDTDCADPGESLTDDDCDDSDAGVNPGATEIPGNTRDENCDGLDDPADTGDVDTGDPETVDPQSFVYRGGSGCTVAPTATGVAGLWVGLIALGWRRRS